MKWKLGVTQWSLPCAVADCVEMAAALGFGAVQVDLGDAEAGYPLTDTALQNRLLSDAARCGVEIVSVVWNDLCKNGFVHAPGDPRRETAWQTIERGIETAARMGVRSVCLPSFFDNATVMPARSRRCAMRASLPRRTGFWSIRKTCWTPRR